MTTAKCVLIASFSERMNFYFISLFGGCLYFVDYREDLCLFLSKIAFDGVFSQCVFEYVKIELLENELCFISVEHKFLLGSFFTSVLTKPAILQIYCN
jgi:hypothetical protein